MGLMEALALLLGLLSSKGSPTTQGYTNSGSQTHQGVGVFWVYGKANKATSRMAWIAQRNLCCRSKHLVEGAAVRGVLRGCGFAFAMPLF
jgi:hypothetical protein